MESVVASAPALGVARGVALDAVHISLVGLKARLHFGYLVLRSLQFSHELNSCGVNVGYVLLLG